MCDLVSFQKYFYYWKNFNSKNNKKYCFFKRCVCGQGDVTKTMLTWDRECEALSLISSTMHTHKSWCGHRGTWEALGSFLFFFRCYWELNPVVLYHYATSPALLKYFILIQGLAKLLRLVLDLGSSCSSLLNRLGWKARHQAWQG